MLILFELIATLLPILHHGETLFNIHFICKASRIKIYTCESLGELEKICGNTRLRLLFHSIFRSLKHSLVCLLSNQVMSSRFLSRDS